MKKTENKISQDKLRQKIDGFSMEQTNEETNKDSFKIVDQSLYATHSADLDEKENITPSHRNKL
jgi:hypothetical protein